MNKPLDLGMLSALLQNPKLEKIEHLLNIIEKLNWDENSETLILRNGKCSISLRSDGSISLEGEKLNLNANQEIVLNGATIDLN